MKKYKNIYNIKNYQDLLNIGGVEIQWNNFNKIINICNEFFEVNGIVLRDGVELEEYIENEEEVV